ncbi:asparagine synthase-domain-containing protein [Phlyctochytrium arcticum]|nr:asparagine synthase-domain-containing protein [Phlyctochytrium arcticum]
MCGILLRLFPAHTELDRDLKQRWENLQQLNSQRGPDAHGSHTWRPTQEISAILEGWTLHLRGTHAVSQPLIDAWGNILCFNGEIFAGLDIGLKQNDTEVLSQNLSKALALKGGRSPSSVIQEELRKVEGPWSLVYWEGETNHLYVGRDRLGRRSLVWTRWPDGSLIFASVRGNDAELCPPVSSASTWQELPADGLYVFNLQTQDLLTDKDVSDTLKPVMPENIKLPWDWTYKLNETAPTVPTTALICPTLSVADLSIATEYVDILERELAQAVRLRIETIPKARNSESARLGVLFSGGLDCICLAALANRFLPDGEPCDLLNVAFENPRTSQGAANIGKRKNNHGAEMRQQNTYDVPDRLTGQRGVAELRRVFPNREWRMVEIDVPYSEVILHRPRIMRLMNPLVTSMDLSIAMAFWFASRGIGKLKSGEQSSDMVDRVSFTSDARVLLSGLGADEQFGGYSRHRKAFEQSGWSELIKEIHLDVSRIASRNLGRDDRIISDHGKEVRFPYLAEPLVDAVGLMPMEVKADLRYDRGIGDKILLRKLCQRLGLSRASVEPKRAVQFGARTAKMEVGSRSTRGHHILVPE